MKTKYLLSTVLIFTLLALPLVSEAAKLSVVAAEKVGVNGDILVTIVAQTDKPINAIEGQISWPGDLLTVKDIRTANSVVSFWVNEPNVKGQTINFSGIVPGGFSGGAGRVFSIVFHTEKPGIALVDLIDSKMLLHNGEGTAAALESKPLSLKIASDLPPKLISGNFEDGELPEAFRPIVGRDPNLAEGRNFLAFSTVDKNSGVLDYQVKEVKYRPFSYFISWQTVASPYILQDQTLNSYIYVKAVDRAGNERMVKVNPQVVVKWYESIWFWGIIILVILFLVATRIKNDQTD